jgi:probable FeS assembly SUF system protein SufT
MQSSSSVLLNRDCDAVQIPAGNTVTLPAGTEIDVVQTLGGSYTIRALGGLFRIASRDSDALGIELQPEAAEPVPAKGPTEDAAGLDPETVWNTLRTCYDPEIPLNIVDLGLVYDMQIEPLASGQKRIAVKMTLTAPGCGMGATIAGDAQQRLLDLPGVAEAHVELVWEPPWHHSLISPAGRAILGLD